MNFNNFKKSIYKNIILSLLISFLLLLNTFPAFAETIEYTYDNTRQIKKATYGNEITVEYTYDGSGNRIIKTILPGTDADGDGMPDPFEIQYGLNPYNPNDADCITGCDPDGDGLTNLQEYRAGTNPTNPDTDSDGILDGNDNCPLNPPVKIAGTYYSTLQAAYDAAIDGDIIQSQAVVLTENLNINLNKVVTLDGGYDCNYITNTGNTTFIGTITISNGTAMIGNFSLEP